MARDARGVERVRRAESPLPLPDAESPDSRPPDRPAREGLRATGCAPSRITWRPSRAGWLAEALTVLQGGTLEAGPVDGGGCRLVLTLPAAE
jgi:hypothetical protein